MKKGMTPEAVESLAEQIRGAGDDANAAYTTIQGRIADFDWTGEDRDRYVPEFDEQVGGANKVVIQRLNELAQKLRSNAQHQRETSNS